MTLHTAAGTPRTRRRAETYERLIDAAVGAFAERGVEGASVEEICERAGFTRGAFYSNFADKDALVLASLRRRCTQQLAQAHAVIAAVTTPDDPGASGRELAIDDAVRLMVASQATETDQLIADREIAQYAIRRPAVARELVQFEAELTEELAALLTEGVSRAGREFTIGVSEAVALVVAVWEAGVTQGLLAKAGEGGDRVTLPESPLVTLLTAITTRTVAG